MINAKYDEEFIFHDGTRAKNILELVLKLERIDSTEFYQFVNSTKNDFANWIGIVLNDNKLAEQLRTVTSREETIRLLKARINDLSTEIVTSHPKYVVPNNTSNMASTAANTIQLLSSSAIHVSKNNNSRDIVSNTSQTASGASGLEQVSYTSQSDQNTKINSGTVSKELKASRNWFKLLLKKDSFNKKLSEIQSDAKLSENGSSTTKMQSSSTLVNVPNTTASDNDSITKHSHNKYFFKRKIHKGLNEHYNKLAGANSTKDIDTDEHESVLWLFVYAILIIMIVGLLIYKLFLS